MCCSKIKNGHFKISSYNTLESTAAALHGLYPSSSAVMGKLPKGFTVHGQCGGTNAQTEHTCCVPQHCTRVLTEIKKQNKNSNNNYVKASQRGPIPATFFTCSGVVVNKDG